MVDQSHRARLAAIIRERAQMHRHSPAGMPRRLGQVDWIFIRGRLARPEPQQILAWELAELERLWAAERGAGRGGAVGFVSFDRDGAGGGLLERFDRSVKRILR